LGYPGRTARHKTAAFLQSEFDVRLPLTVELYQWQMDVLTEAGRQDRTVEIKHAARMRSLANVEKRSRGQLKGMRQASSIAKRQAEEVALQAFIEADATRDARYGNVLSELADIHARAAQALPWEMHLSQLRTACQALGTGFFLWDAAVERQKQDVEREAMYMDRNWDQTVQQLRTSLRDYHPATDSLMLSGLLQRMQQRDKTTELPVLQKLVAEPTTLDLRCAELIQGSQLGEVPFVDQCLLLSAQELKNINDPMLQLAIELYPTYLALREVDKAREGQLSQLYADLVEIKQQFLQRDFIPDANGTLRLTSGTIRGYSPEDAVIKTPIASLSGVIEKTTGIEPFITPPQVLEKYAAAQFGPFQHAGLKDVPVAILYDTDTTGGNSGSPVLNARGELVGVNFDRCFEATINDFAWDQRTSRSIGVDIRYVLWISGIVYEAHNLLEELGVRLDQKR